MESVQIQTAQNVAIDVEVAGLGDRFLAALIDYLILGCYFVAVLVLGGAASAPEALLIVLLLPAFLYFLLCEIFLNGQSVGKKLRRIKVARLDGGQPTLGSYLLRWLLRPVDVWLTSGVAGIVCILVTGSGQRLGDLAAGTTVIEARRRAALDDTLFARLDEAHTLTFPQAERLSGEDVALAKDVLAALRTDGASPAAQALGRQLKTALEAKMGVASDLPPPAFLQTVVEDYNHLSGRLG